MAKKVEQKQEIKVNVSLDKIREAVKDVAGVNKLVDTAITDQKKAYGSIARAMIATVCHAHIHGDVRPMTRLITDTANYAGRRNAMIGFCEKHGPISWDSANKKVRYRKARALADFMDNVGEDSPLLAMLEDAPNWKAYSPEPEYKPFNALEQFEKFAKRVVNKAENATKKDNIPESLLNDLVILAKRHGLELELPTDDSKELATKQVSAAKQDAAVAVAKASKKAPATAKTKAA
ncbi:hypothetical protein [Zhongshania sp.]|uniref:hypothetical protein n=1 Tax=Zhongshania sp. TaxID=1971902 RepID=UPI003565DA7E